MLRSLSTTSTTIVFHPCSSTHGMTHITMMGKQNQLRDERVATDLNELFRANVAVPWRFRLIGLNFMSERVSRATNMPRSTSISLALLRTDAHDHEFAHGTDVVARRDGR